MRIKQIINSILSSNSYIISNSELNSFWLIDIGDIAPIIEYLPQNALIDAVLLTHTHFDHIYGVNDLLIRFPSCKIYTCIEGLTGLYSDKYNYSRYNETPINFKGGDIQIINEGDVIKIFNTDNLHVYYTPGHDPSCLTFRLGSYLFTGDSYIPYLKVTTFFLRSNRSLANESRNRIKSLINYNDYICPGHGNQILGSSLINNNN